MILLALTPTCSVTPAPTVRILPLRARVGPSLSDRAADVGAPDADVLQQIIGHLHEDALGAAAGPGLRAGNDVVVTARSCPTGARKGARNAAVACENFARI
jgi:hypothetical protein